MERYRTGTVSDMRFVMLYCDMPLPPTDCNRSTDQLLALILYPPVVHTTWAIESEYKSKNDIESAKNFLGILRAFCSSAGLRDH